MADNPFGGLGPVSSDSPFGGLPKPTYKPPKKKKKKLTVRQYLALMEAEKQKDKQHRSFGSRLKGVGKGALGGATVALTQIMRPSWAVSAATDAAWTAHDKFERGEVGAKDLKKIAVAAKQGFSGEVRMGMGEVLDKHGVLKGHAKTRGVVGFGLDVFTDPLMALSVAAAPATGGSSIAAYTTAKAAGRAVGTKVIQSAAREAGPKVLKGEIDDVLEEVLTSGGKQFEHRLALLKHNKALASGEADNLHPLIHQKNILEQMAQAEARVYDPRTLKIGLGSRKHNVAINTRIPVITRPGAKLAQRGIPVLSQMSDGLGRAFIPGFKNDIINAAGVARKHIANQNGVYMRDQLKTIMHGMDESLTDDDMLDALHLFEQPLRKRDKSAWKAVVAPKTPDGIHTLNKQYVNKLLREGHLTEQQVDFVNRYQQATEFLIKTDQEAGVLVDNLSASGRLYVPHVLKKKTGEDVPTVAQHGLLTDAGFQGKRKGPKLSVKQIKEMVDNKTLPNDIETNPMELLWRRARAGSERQADMALINTLKASVGVPTRLVNPKRVGRAQARFAAAQAKGEGATRAAAHAEQEYNDAIERVAAELAGVHEVAQKAIQNKIKNLRIGARATQVKKLQKQIDEIALKLKRARKPENIHKLQAELDGLEKQLQALHKKRIMTPGIVKAEAQKVSNTKKLEQALKDLENPKSAAHKDALKNELDTHTAAIGAKKDVEKELKTAAKSLKDAMRGKKNRAATKDMIEVSKAVDEYGNVYRFPKEAGNELKRLERLVSGNDETVEQFTHSISKWMGAWKVLVTTVNPGYRIRNTMTDFWNMWVAGVPTWAIGTYGKKSAHLMARAKRAHITQDPKDLEAFFTLMQAGNHGILSGLFAGDVQMIARMLKYQNTGAKELFKNGKFIGGYTKVMQDFNRNAENWGRLTHYLYRVDNLKESLSEAAFRVKIAHFDYEDLTPFEQKVMKNIFPFYTWTRKNIPYQVRQIMAEPGRYSAFPKMAQEAEYAAGGDDNIVPDYIESGMGFQIGKGKYYMPQFGVSDLSPFQGKDEAKHRLFNLLGPQFKIPAEIATGRSIFTGQDIVPENHSRVPISDRGASILGLLPGSDVGQTQRSNGDGTYDTSQGVNPWLSYFAGQIPGSRTALGIGAGTDEKQNSQLISYFLGQSVQNVDPKQQVIYASQDIMRGVDELLAQYRDEGKIPRNKRKKSSTDKLIESVLGGN